MGRRSKGLKRKGVDGGDCRVDFASGSPDGPVEEVDFIAQGERQLVDSGCCSARCSVHLIHEVVSAFDNEKRDIVESIGFGGILHFPPVKQFNRRFAVWLMGCVDADSASLRVGQHISMRFNKLDVANVFGIPCSGKKIIDPLLSCRDSKDFVLENFLGRKFKDERSIKSVQEIIDRRYSSPMSKAESDNFKVAFVVFIVSNLLVPSARHDYACVDYWNAIRDPDAIFTYDWSDFVFVRLLEAVTKLKLDVSSNIKFPNITGCLMFIQVLYLDSIDLQGFSMNHNSFPRVRDFSYVKMRAMILADNNYAMHIRGCVDLVPVPLRNPRECIYSWALEFNCPVDDRRGGALLAIWETAVAMVHLLNIPLEAAGPLFVAAADFQEQINSGLVITGSQAVRFMGVLVSIMIPYRRGFSLKTCNTVDLSEPGVDIISGAISNGIRLMSFPIRRKVHRFCNTVFRREDNGARAVDACSSGSTSQSYVGREYYGATTKLDHSNIGDDVQQSFNAVIGSLDGTPHHLNMDLRVANAMSQFYSVLGKLKPVTGADLNGYVSDCCNVTVMGASGSETPCTVVASPWELGYCWSFVGVDSSKIFDEIGCLCGEQRPVIIHPNPKYIQVTGSDFVSQIRGVCEFEPHLVDALVRIVREEDDRLYSSFGQLRWRHYFESDLMESILSGSFDLLDTSLSNHLVLSCRYYDLRSVKFLFFPALLQCRWVCFVWSLDDNIIYVFEPSFGAVVPDSRVVLIERACYLLKIAMQTLAGSVMEGWSHQCTAADMRMLTLQGGTLSRSIYLNRSGAICSLFFRCFNGNNLCTRFEEGDTDRVAVKLLHDIACWKHNAGSFPSQLFH